MADIKLFKPQAGQQTRVESVPDARLEFTFPADAAVLEKSGNDLVFTFDDGSSLVLADFYTAYTKENMPDFVVEGQNIAGADFFAALSSDLMPAAGPAAAQAPAGGRYHDFGTADLMDGINRLDGLDLPWARPGEEGNTLIGMGIAGLDPTLTGAEAAADINLPPVLGSIGSQDSLVLKEEGVQDGGNTAEPGVQTMGGHLSATDANGDALQWYFVDAAGNKVPSITTAYGSITMDAQGNYVYTLNNTGPANNLGQGDSYTESFTVGVQDNRGGVSETQSVEVTIQGTNDQPTVTVTVPELQLSAEDNGQVLDVKDKGTAEGDDVDKGAELGYTFTLADGTSATEIQDDYGTLTIDPASGEYVYTLNPDSEAVRALAQGEVFTQQQLVRVQDEHGAWSEQSITVTITGGNDRPTIDVSHSDLSLDLQERGVQNGGNEPEPGHPTASGNVAGKDVDSTDTLRYSAEAHLPEGDKVLGNTTAPDGTQTLTTTYGTLLLQTDGSYTYTLTQGQDSAANALAQGEAHTQTFTITVSDGHGGTVQTDISVNIVGTNDRPTLTVTNAELNVTAEDNAIPPLYADASGTAEGDDVDNGADLTYQFKLDDGSFANEITDEYGTLSLVKNGEGEGSYKYTLLDNDAVKALGQGESITQSHTVRVQDEHGAWSEQQISVTIKGGNDAPVIESVTNEGLLLLQEKGVENGGNEPEAGIPRIIGKIEAQDADRYAEGHPGGTRDTLIYEFVDESGVTFGDWTNIQDNYGTLSLNSVTGEYKYVLDNIRGNMANALSQGESYERTYTVRVSDGHGGTVDQPLHVKIQGTNDQPTLKIDGVRPQDHQLVEDSDTTVSGNFVTKDYDNDGAEQHYSITCKDAQGNTVQGTAVDGATGTDSNGNATYQTPYGILTLIMGENGKGTYTFVMDNTLPAVQALSQDQAISLNFGITVKDAHDAFDKGDITITIKGTNDAPVIEATEQPIALEVKEAGVHQSGDTWNAETPGTPVASGTMKIAHDVDAGDTVSYFITMGENTVPISGTLVNGVYTFATEYGTFTINSATGALNFYLDNDNKDVNGLNFGDEPLVQNIHVHVKDQHGVEAEATQNVHIEIQGTNDRPLLTLDDYHDDLVDTGVGGENVTDGTHNATVEDVDTQDTQTFSILLDGKSVGTKGNDGTVTYDTPYGTLTITADGKYTYILDPAKNDVRELSVGEMHTETFTIRVTDAHNATSDKPFTVTIKGTNDLPIVTETTELSVQEDGGTDNVIRDGNRTSIVGSVTAHDVDNGSSIHYDLLDGTALRQTMLGQMDGKYGYLELDHTTGKYTYTLFNDSTAVQELAAGETKVETFTVRVTDEKGEYTDATITVNVTGSNDTPTISGNTLTAYEDNGAVINPDEGDSVQNFIAKDQQLVVEDMDIQDRDTLSFSVEADANSGMTTTKNDDGSYTITSEYGILTLRLDGTYDYELTYHGSDLQAKNAGEKFGQDVFTIMVKSGDEEISTKITVDIMGTNDRPGFVLNGEEVEVTGIITPDTNHEEVGDTDANDVDDDKTGLTFHIMNGYDAANKPADGTFEDTDGLKPANPLWQPEQTSEGKYGSLTINPETGEYSYTLNILSDAVKNWQGDSEISESFQITVTDPHGATETKTLTVSVPKPDIPSGGDGTGGLPGGIKLTIAANLINVTEDGALSGENTVIVSGHVGDESDKPLGDIDPTAQLTLFYAFKNADGEFVQTISDQYGSVTINPITGHYVYTLNNDSKYVQELKGNEKIDDRDFTVHLVVPNGDGFISLGDGTLEVTIIGTNDAPEIDSVDGLTVVEDAGNTPDQHDSVTMSGHVQAHDVDKCETDDIIYTFTFGDIVITGTGTITTAYGTFTTQADGHYTYTLNSEAAQSLAEGQSINETITVSVTNKNMGTADKADTQDITVTIQGTNDQPALFFTTSDTLPQMDAQGNLTVTEDGILSAHGNADFTDVDKLDKHEFTVSSADGAQISSHGMAGTYGTLLLNPKTGEYEYRLDNNHADIQKLTANGQVSDSFIITVQDNHGGESSQTITVTIQGTNDAPEIRFTDGKGHELADGSLNFVENGSNTVVSGHVGSDDVDAGAILTYGVKASAAGSTASYVDGLNNGSVQGIYGSLSIGADGKYSYTPIPNMDTLSNGEQATETFTLLVRDEHGAVTELKVDVNLTGTNDAPTMHLSQSTLHLSEDATTGNSLTGQASGHDLDHGAELSYGVTVAGGTGTASYATGNTDGSASGSYGSLSIHADGTYTYIPGDIQFLGVDDTVQDSFTLWVKDEYGASVQQNVTINLTGTNDAPVIQQAASNLSPDLALNDEGIFAAQGIITAEDVDGDTLIYSLLDDSADPNVIHYGELVVNDDGSYSYTLAGDAQITAGMQDHFTIQVDDGHGGTVNQEIVVDLSPAIPDLGASDLVPLSTEGLAPINAFSAAVQGRALLDSRADLNSADPTGDSHNGPDASLYSAFGILPEGYAQNVESGQAPYGPTGPSGYGTEEALPDLFGTTTALEGKGVLIEYEAQTADTNLGVDLTNILGESDAKSVEEILNSLDSTNNAPLPTPATAAEGDSGSNLVHTAEAGTAHESLETITNNPATPLAEDTDAIAARTMIEHFNS